MRVEPDDEGDWRAEIEAGIVEMDAGNGVSLEEFEDEMDAFMAELRAKGP